LLSEIVSVFGWALFCSRWSPDFLFSGNIPELNFKCLTFWWPRRRSLGFFAFSLVSMLCIALDSIINRAAFFSPLQTSCHVAKCWTCWPCSALCWTTPCEWTSPLPLWTWSDQMSPHQREMSPWREMPRL